MITVKIQCGCGQRYAFDAEPTFGRMPQPVACPVCGADGTAAANTVLAQSQPAPVAAAAPTVRLAGTPPPAPAAEPRRAVLLPGQVDRSQAEHEARAKIFWGDPPDEVVKFLMRQGIAVQEAKDLVQEFYNERAASLRSGGIGKIVTGLGLVAIPIAGWFGFAAIGVIPLKLFAIMVMLGLWGAWRILKGTLMVVAPKAQQGDVASQ